MWFDGVIDIGILTKMGLVYSSMNRAVLLRRVWGKTRRHSLRFLI